MEWSANLCLLWLMKLVDIMKYRDEINAGPDKESVERMSKYR